MKKTAQVHLIFSLSILFSMSSFIDALPNPNAFDLTLPYHPEEFYCYQTINDLKLSTYEIHLEDGSEWKVTYPDRMQMLSWRLNDRIVFTPNNQRSDFSFCITNQSAKSSVNAKYIKKPLSGGPRTIEILSIDKGIRNNPVISLNNGTVWSVDESDFFIIEDWEKGHPIIFGHNDEWFAKYRTILIDLETNSYIRAKKL